MNGSPVTLNSSVTVTPVSACAADLRDRRPGAVHDGHGNYVLIVNASKIIDYANNTGTGTAAVTWTATQTVADATITNTVDNATPHEGSIINFTVTVSNAGPADATDMTVLDLLPSGLTLMQSSAPSGTSYDTTTGVWSIAQFSTRYRHADVDCFRQHWCRR